MHSIISSFHSRLMSSILLTIVVCIIASCNFDFAKDGIVEISTPTTVIESIQTPTSSATVSVWPSPSSTSPILNLPKIESPTSHPLISSPTPEPTPEPTPAPTERPIIAVAAPNWWVATLEKITGKLGESGSLYRWRFVKGEEEADIVLKVGDDGISAGQHPLSLAVPFTTDWEEITLQEANIILSDGHPQVTVMDWSEMTTDQKALRINDKLPFEIGYPLQQEWSLYPRPGFESTALELSTVLLANESFEPVVHLAAVGDLMLDRALGTAIKMGDLNYPFANVADQLSTADITIGNMESSLGTLGEPAAKSYTFQAPPEAALSLGQAGFDIVSLANNHAMDFGPAALRQGIELLGTIGIATIGGGVDETAARAAKIVEINGIQLAFLGYVDVPVEYSGFDTEIWTASGNSPGVAWAYPEWIAADVAAARLKADVVIVFLHSGFEYIEQPSPPQITAAYAAVDAGAQLVIGHHAHVLQGVEYYNGGVIAYGLGNFAFELDGDPQTTILNVWLDKQGIRQVEFVPAIIQFGGQPRLAESWEAGPIRRRIYHLTNLLNR